MNLHVEARRLRLSAQKKRKIAKPGFDPGTSGYHTRESNSRAMGPARFLCATSHSSTDLNPFGMMQWRDANIYAVSASAMLERNFSGTSLSARHAAASVPAQASRPPRDRARRRDRVVLRRREHRDRRPAPARRVPRRALCARAVRELPRRCGRKSPGSYLCGRCGRLGRRGCVVCARRRRLLGISPRLGLLLTDVLQLASLAHVLAERVVRVARVVLVAISSADLFAAPSGATSRAAEEQAGEARGRDQGSNAEHRHRGPPPRPRVGSVWRPFAAGTYPRS